MKRTLFGLVAAVGLVGFATAAGASTLSFVTDAASYDAGDTITLTVSGDAQGGIAPGDQIRVIIAQSGVTVTQNGGNSVGGANGNTYTQFGGGLPALVGGNQGLCAWALGRDNQCLIWDQAVNASGSPVDAGVHNAVFTYTVPINAPAGSTTFAFQDAIGSDCIFFSQGNEVDTNTCAALGSVTVQIVPIPEPTTAALLGLGLSGLVLAGSRRLY